MSAITNLYAGVPVTDLDEHAALFIESTAVHADAGRITLGVAGLDALLERLAARASTTSRSRPRSERRSYGRIGPRIRPDGDSD